MVAGMARLASPDIDLRAGTPLRRGSVQGATASGQKPALYHAARSLLFPFQERALRAFTLLPAGYLSICLGTPTRLQKRRRYVVPVDRETLPVRTQVTKRIRGDSPKATIFTRGRSYMYSFPMSEPIPWAFP